MADGTKCEHGYFAHLHCPWCRGFDSSSADVVAVNGHGNGWLLRRHDPICSSCGGPSTAGWGMRLTDNSNPPPQQCYSCRSGSNTREAITKRAAHDDRRGVKKVKGSKAS